MSPTRILADGVVVGPNARVTGAVVGEGRRHRGRGRSPSWNQPRSRRSAMMVPNEREPSPVRHRRLARHHRAKTSRSRTSDGLCPGDRRPLRRDLRHKPGRWSSATTRASSPTSSPSTVARVLAGNGFRVAAGRPPGANSRDQLPHHRSPARAAASSSPVSHNPFRWNGIKVKPHYGGSASPEIVADIERRVPAILATPGAVKLAPLTSDDIERFDPDPGLSRHARRTGRHSPASARPASKSQSTRCTAPARGSSTNCSLAGKHVGHGDPLRAQPSIPGHSRSRTDRVEPWRVHAPDVRRAGSTSGSRTTATPTASASSTRRATTSTSCARSRSS